MSTFEWVVVVQLGLINLIALAEDTWNMALTGATLAQAKQYFIDRWLWL